MSIRKIMKTLLHPTTIKIVALICIIGFFFIHPTFPQGTETSKNGLAGVQEALDNLLKLCSRGWVILAILAGKLMTNDWVYGSIIHMDIYLWKIRNIMKNFANFALIGIVLVNIIKNLVGKEKIDIKGIITKTLLAGVLIQASRFLVGALVDVSTIAVSAVGSFPSSFLKTDAKLQSQIVKSLTTTPKRFLVGMTGSMKIIDTGAVNTNNWDEILPSYNSVSGPLIYLGFSVFKFQNYTNTEGSTGAVELTISFLLRVILILFYTLGLALLFIANIIRVAFLRIFIIAAPIIVLFQLFSKDKGGGGSGITKYMSFGVMVDLIFKPVIFVAGFSMILILVVSMQSIMNGTLPKSFNGVTIGVESGASTLEIEGITNIKVQENSIRGKDPFDTTGVTGVKETGQTIFVNLLLFFFTAFLMRQFIKMSATSGKGPITDVMKPLTENIEKFAKTLPILPLAGGASITGAQTFLGENTKKMLGSAGISTRGEFGEMGKNGAFTTQQEKFKEWMTGDVNRKGSDYTQLQQIADSSEYSKFFGSSIELAKTRKGGLSLSNTSRLNTLQKALNTPGKATTLGFRGAWESGVTAEKYFENEGNRKALYEKLGGDPASGKSLSGTIPTWEQLQGLSFYATEATGATKE